MIYLIIGAIVVGLSLGIFGSGGSILTVPVLIYLLKHPDKPAIAESLAIVGSIACISAIPYALAKLVDWRTAIIFGIPGTLGTFLGAQLSAFVPGYVQLFVFAGVMAFAAYKMWRNASNGAAKSSTPNPKSHSILAISIEGLAVGVLTGFVGVGGGFLIVPALVLLAGLDMRRAIATSLVIIAIKSAVGFWKYLQVLESDSLTVDWNTIALFIFFGAIGSISGKALNAKLNQSALRRGFAIFLIVMACFILIKESLALLLS